MYFHDRLIELRRQNGWSQETLGNKLNVSRQTVSKWELGQTTPDMNNLREMSAIFNISLDELVSGHQADSKSDRSTPFSRKHFEYKSKARFLNLPLVHINAGRGAYRAKGIIAIGNIATGIFAIGIVSIGVISFGALSLGLLLALGGLSLGAVAGGGIAIGLLAAGGLSFGYLSIGGASFGAYAVGGYAKAKYIALGGYADGIIAIGERARGTYTLLTGEISSIDDAAKNIEEAISVYLPKTNQMIAQFFLSFF